MTDLSWRRCHVHEIDSGFIEGFIIELRTPNPGEGHRPLIGKTIVNGVTLEHITSSQPARSVIRNRRLNDEQGGGWAISDVTMNNLTAAGKPIELIDETGQPKVEFLKEFQLLTH